MQDIAPRNQSFRKTTFCFFPRDPSRSRKEHGVKVRNLYFRARDSLRAAIPPLGHRHGFLLSRQLAQSKKIWNRWGWHDSRTLPLDLQVG